MAIIDKPSDYFNTVLYTGNDTDNRTVSGVGFQPDFLWIKARNNADSHYLQDVVRGSTKVIFSNSSSAEDTRASAVKSFASDGFVLGQEAQVNRNSGTFVSWNWLGANGTASNSNGSITSTVSANTTSGCSIVKWSGSGSNATIGHGLGVAPSMVITKSTGGSSAWGVYHISLGNTKILFLDETGAVGTNVAYWNNTSPTSSVFTVGSDAAVNHSGNNMIAYCFTEITNYSKFGFYVGDALNKGGPFVYTGFRPAWIMIKRTDGADTWTMYDNKRIGYNVDNNPLFANATTTESTDDDLDILSNGFKIKRNSGRINTDGANMVYMAFAENPFVTSTDNGSIPATAR
jgi:hypothetical protein